MDPIRCFLVEYSGRGRLYRRRFVFSTAAKCPAPLGFHNARLDLGIEVADPIVETDGHKHLAFVHSRGTPDERADGRWPTSCECGYVFTEADEWMIGTTSIYRRPETGEEKSLQEFGPGATWNAFWMGGGFGRPGPDGAIWCVRLPDGVEWCVDGPARDGGYWTREGTAPRLTARPSILTPGYHGFLTDGMLASC